MELRRDDVRHFAGLYIHHLKKTKDGYRIKLQRVDMNQRAGGLRLRAAGVGCSGRLFRRIIPSIPADPQRRRPHDPLRIPTRARRSARR